jgi:hypothetical protein
MFMAENKSPHIHERERKSTLEPSRRDFLKGATTTLAESTPTRRRWSKPFAK